MTPSKEEIFNNPIKYQELIFGNPELFAEFNKISIENQKKKGSVKPWDALNPNAEKASAEEAARRYAICKSCPELIKATKQCKQCGCFMKVKTKLLHAECPIGKWGKERVQLPPKPAAKMFDFTDINSNEYNQFIKFVDIETNKPKTYAEIPVEHFPYGYKKQEELGEFRSFSQENILTKQESEYLIELANCSETWLIETIPFWVDRNLPFFDMMPRNADRADIMDFCKNIYYRIKEFISDSFKEEVWADQMGIVRWPAGSWQMAHIDEVHGLDRVAGCVVFLNDDYEGGEPFYPFYNKLVTPKQGMVYAHDAGFDHLHGVTQIKNKTRYTISTTWTRTKDKCPYLQHI